MPHTDPEKGKAYRREWSQQHRDKKRAAYRRWYEKNKERVREYQQQPAQREKQRERDQQRSPESRKQHVESHRVWVAKDKEKRNAYMRNYRRQPEQRFVFWTRRLREYGLSREEFDALIVQHEGQCEICNRLGTANGGLQPDHNHENGKFRGLLCSDCNVSLGNMGDNPVWLRRAADYLERKE